MILVYMLSVSWIPALGACSSSLVRQETSQAHPHTAKNGYYKPKIGLSSNQGNGQERAQNPERYNLELVPIYSQSDVLLHAIDESP